MSLTTLTTEAIEEGSYFITVSFYNEDDDAVTPNAATIFWTLVDDNGSVINDRDYEAETSGTSITIELGEDDLAIQSWETVSIVQRHLIIQWEYDSDLGNDKLAKAVCTFPLRNLKRLPVLEV